MTLLGQLETSAEPDLSGWTCVEGQDPARVGRAVRHQRRADELSVLKTADRVPRIADEPDSPIRGGGQRDLLIRHQAFALGEGSHLVLAKAIQSAARPEPEVAFPILERRIHDAAGEIVLDAKPIERGGAAQVPGAAQAAVEEANP